MENFADFYNKNKAETGQAGEAIVEVDKIAEPTIEALKTAENGLNDIKLKVAEVLNEFNNIKVVKTDKLFKVVLLDDLTSPFMKICKKIKDFFINKKSKVEDNADAGK